MRGADSKDRISIHALLAESDIAHLVRPQASPISIHALLAESDSLFLPSYTVTYNFYPRSPCGERPALPYALKADFEISIHALLAESDGKCIY